MKGPSLQHAQHHYQQSSADVYDAKRQKKVKWRLEYQCLESMLWSVEGTVGTVLDVPVGTGRFLQLYRDHGLKVVGVDYNDSMLEHARKLPHAKLPHVKLEQGDITKLVFADASFDIVVCVRMLHLVAPNEVAPIMRELFRVARSHVIVSANLDEVARPKKRSQIHTLDTLLSCVHPPWSLDKSVLVLKDDPKLGPYYMLHFKSLVG